MAQQINKQRIEEKTLFQRRLAIAATVMILLIAVLIGRLIALQIFEHAKYKALSEANQYNMIPIPPPRGLIYDRNGVLLADNMPVYSLDIINKVVKDIPGTIKSLQQIIAISPDDIEQFQKIRRQSRPLEPMPLKMKLSDDEVAKFYLNQYRFPGVMVNARLIRHYPMGDTMVTPIGYVGRINEEEMKKVDQTNYSASNYIGKIGLEKHYEALLHGKVGYQQVEIDAGGRVVKTLKRTEPVPGANIYLSIDSKLQIAAEKALGDHRGAVVAIDPQTGQVLALVSNPRYDPNIFVRGVTPSEFSALQNAPDRPLYNRAVRGQYPPGSTIKPFYAIEGLDSETVTPGFKINDPGYFSLPNSRHVYRDWKKGGHGVVDVYRAIVVSCDIYFYNLAVKMGIDKMEDILKRFGFGANTGLDIDEELSGNVPNPQWKKQNRHEQWYPGDTVITGIGQGFLLFTPVQQAAATAALAMHGKRFQPRMLLKIQNQDGSVVAPPPVPLAPVNLTHPKVWDLVIAGMVGVVRDQGGTAYAFGRNPPYNVAGKTGTAEVPRPAIYKTYTSNAGIPEKYRSHSWFIAYAPVENPSIALCVIVENNPGKAVIVAKQIFDYYFHVNDPTQSPTTEQPDDTD